MRELLKHLHRHLNIDMDENKVAGDRISRAVASVGGSHIPHLAHVHGYKHKKGRMHSDYDWDDMKY